MAAYRDLPAGVLTALALRELAGQLPEIGQLTVTPDLLTGVLTRLANGTAGHTNATVALPDGAGAGQ